MYYPFDSRNTLYKSIFGAAASGETLKLRLLLHNDARVYEAYLRLRCDDDDRYREILMVPGDWLDGYRFYECDLTLEEGLYFYSFRYTSEYGEFFVTAFRDNVGHVSPDGRWWQLTCYDKDFTTPNWLSGGIIYQIFPDRFYNSGKEKQDVPSDRYLTANWEKQPEYRQNNGPCSLGNDYYGGDLDGITEKLPYIASLGVTCIYLNPIFESHSNHRYNTADYRKIDPLLGDEKSLQRLCREAKKRGISIVLDGVFSHTGDDSIYFNKYKRYGEGGAYNSTESPYFSWYKFGVWPNDYHAWWGVPSLPEIKEEDPSFDEFITGENGILRYWLKKGVRGWRLDVADELPDCILDHIRTAIKTEKPDAYLLGEVWEDATNKISYGHRRRYLRGKQLDSVMNYPFAQAIISFVGGGDGFRFMDSILSVLENYPPQAVNVLMNHLGTHDTARLLTRLARRGESYGNRAWQSAQVLSDEEMVEGIKKQKLAAVIQYTLPGVPSLYYGDEAGVQGYSDPFCRGTYPWGKENTELLEFYKALGAVRREHKAFDGGEFIPVLGGLGLLAYVRQKGNSKVLIAVNRWYGDDVLDLPHDFHNAKAIFGNSPADGRLHIGGQSFAILTV